MARQYRRLVASAMSNSSPAVRDSAGGMSTGYAAAARARGWQHRVDAAEWLDQPGVSPEAVTANLRDFEFVNRHLGGARSVLAHIPPIFDATRAGEPLRVLDIACGAGDILRSIAGFARRAQRPLLGVGVDANPRVIAYARAVAGDLGELAWMRGNALNPPFGSRSFDLVICSAFIHHLTPDQALTCIQHLARVSRGWLIVSDVVRSHGAYLSYPLLAWSLDFAPITRHDGAVSLRRAYTPDELAEFAAAAGLSNWKVYRHRFCRMSLVCGRDED